MWLEAFLDCLSSKGVKSGPVPGPVPGLEIFLVLVLEVLASRGASVLYCLEVDLGSLFLLEEELEEILCCGEGEGLVTVREEEEVCLASFLLM